MICQPLRSTNRSPPCVDSRPPAHRAGTPHIALTRRAPRRLRRRPRRERSASRSSLTSQIHSSPSSERSTGISQAPPWPSGPGVCRGRPTWAGLPGYAGALRALYCPPTPRVTHSGPCHPQAASPQRLRRERFAPAAAPRRFALGRPVPIGTVVTCVAFAVYQSFTTVCRLVDKAFEHMRKG